MWNRPRTALRFAAPLPLLLLLLMHTSASRAEEGTVQTYPVPGHASLELLVPKAWLSEAPRPPGNLPPTIALRPAEGDAFVVRITPLLNPGRDPDFNSDAKIKAAAELVKGAIAPTAVEQELVLTLLKGPAAHGYYFTATDKAPRPGEYLCMTSAVVGVGDLLLNVTILHQAKDAKEVGQTIEMLKEARQRKPEAP